MLKCRLHTSVFLGIVLIVAGGCDWSGHSNVVEVFGTVTYGGQLLDMGQIRFVPIEGTKGPTSGAAIMNGQYTVTNRGGVPFGKHRVEIRANRPNEDAEPVGENVPDYRPGDKPLEQYISARYNTQSELIEVVPENAKNHEANFQLDE